jgi:hypothetical protein
MEGQVKSRPDFWNLYEDEHGELNKQAHYNNKAAKVFFLYITPFLLVGATALSAYGLTQGITHHDIATIAGSGVGLAVTVITIAGCIFLFVRLKNAHEAARNKQANLERTKVISEDAITRVAFIRDREQRSKILKSLSNKEIEAFITFAKCAIGRIKEAKADAEARREAWHSLVVELLCLGSGEMAHRYINENSDEEGPHFLSIDDRKKIYNAQLTKEGFTAADADQLMRRMHADVVKYGEQGWFPKEEYRQLFIKYAKPVSFPTFVEYFCVKPQNLPYRYSAQEMAEAFKLQAVFSKPKSIHQFVLAAHEYYVALNAVQGVSKVISGLKAAYKECIDVTLEEVGIIFRTKNEGNGGCYADIRDDAAHVEAQKVYLLSRRNRPEHIKVLFEALSEEKRNQFIQEFIGDGTPLVDALPEFRALVYKSMTPSQIVTYVQRMHYDSLGRDPIAHIDEHVLKTASPETLVQMLELLSRPDVRSTPSTAIFVGMLLNRLIHKDYDGKLDRVGKHYPFVAGIHQGLCVQEFMDNQAIKDRVSELKGRAYSKQRVILQQGEDNEEQIRDLAAHLRTKIEGLDAKRRGEVAQQPKKKK